MKRNYDAVFFDFDGTIADTSKGIFASADYAARALGLPLPDEAGHRYFMGPPLTESFDVIFGLKGEDGINAVKKYREYYTAGGMFELEFYPGIIELLNELISNGVKTAVTSSKPEMFVSQILEHYGIADRIDHIACPHGDNMPESKYSLITRAIEHFKIDKSRALMLGDRYLDMQGAVQAGIDGCGALWGYGTEEELLNAGARFIARNAGDVSSLVFSEETK